MHEQPVKAWRWVALVGAVLAGVAYLWMLGCRGRSAEPDLVILYTAGPVDEAPVHPETGVPLWASPADVQAEVERIRQRRQARDLPTLVLDTRPATDRLELLEIAGHWVVLQEIAAEGDRSAAARQHDLNARLAALGRQAPYLHVVATSRPVAEVAVSFPAPLVVLPGRYSEGVPQEVEVRATGAALVTPWVDSRYRIGELRVVFDTPPSLEGRVVELQTAAPRPQGSTTIGVGTERFAYDPIHFGQHGLGHTIAEAMVEATGADLALVNYLSVRHDLVGPVDMVDLQEALPFHNQIDLLTLTGAQILALLEPNKAEDTSYLLVAGLVNGADGIWRDTAGAPVDPAADYRLATLDYLASGARGKRPIFLEGRDPFRTGLYTDRLVIDILLANRGGMN